jgi:alpha-tubulin suppressor-like RCC1 family protein
MNQNTPIIIEDLNDKDIKCIFAAFDNSAILTKEKELLVWGKTRDGSIGQFIGGGISNITVPGLFPYFDQIEGKIENFSISREHGGLVTDKGKIYTWGIDLYGKLGHSEDSYKKVRKKLNK